MGEKKLKDDSDLAVIESIASGFEGNVFEAIVENFPDVIWSVDQGGKIVSINKKAEELLGYSKSELIGMSIFNLYSEKVRVQLEKGFTQLKKQGFKDHVRSKLKSKDDQEIDVEIRSLSLYNDKGEFVKTFSIIRDMREIYTLRSQVQQQSKLAAVGELAAGIMHDIRNPLTVIMSYNGHFLPNAISKQDWELTQKCQELVDKATLKIKKLTDHMRSYSRSEEDQLAKTDLEEIVEDCLLMTQSRQKESMAKVVNNIAGTGLQIICRPNQIEQVLINLVSNACDALKGHDKRTVTLNAKTEDGHNIIEVTDSGPGIPADIQENIFESFFTTKKKGQGTGLGLSMCRGIIRNHEGELSVVSEPGKGATFTIKIPVDPKPSDS